MSGIWLSMVEYMKYVGGNANSRCVHEGEEVVNAGHIILYGKTEESRNHIKLIALCIQSSAIYSDPHEISGMLTIGPNNKVKIVSMICSCKAGLGGSCKHISGVLILFTRVDLSKIETISQTDLKCVWSNQKVNTQEKYKAVPLREMPCLKEKVSHTNYCDFAVCSQDVLSDIAALLPECALSRLRVGRSNAEERNEEIEVPARENFSNILDNACQSITMMRLYSENISFQSDCCEKIYSTLMNENQSDVIEVLQSSSTWHELRKFRITGSRCYEIFTYAGQSWNIKAEKYFWPKSFTNKYVRHGLKFEDDARHAFVAATGFKTIQCGMVISHSNKWIGYSPDGIIIDNNDNPVALLEIKCPWNGATSTISQAILSCNFISDNSLKTRHKYYGQIQLGLSVLNLKKCYLALYSSYDDSIIIIEVEYNEEFTEKMLLKIKSNYFEKMLHTICECTNRK